MDNQWKAEKCGTCDFTNNDWVVKTHCRREECKKTEIARCRKNPPVISTGVAGAGGVIERYPLVTKDTAACSCWRERQNNEK